MSVIPCYSKTMIVMEFQEISDRAEGAAEDDDHVNAMHDVSVSCWNIDSPAHNAVIHLY
jgi:hypothetical protein